MKLLRVSFAFGLLFLFVLPAVSQQKFDKEEFARRRAALFEQIRTGSPWFTEKKKGRRQ